jgi:uncharacterized membrane protein
MATLTVWQFATPDGAEAAEDVLVELQQQNLIVVHDDATVSWPADAKRPKTRQLSSTPPTGLTPCASPRVGDEARSKMRQARRVTRH